MMLAIGHANGKVTFCTFGLATVNNTLAGLELGPSKNIFKSSKNNFKLFCILF